MDANRYQRLEILMRRLRPKRLATRVSGALAAMLALVPGAGAAKDTAPQSLATSDAPAAWVAYAEAVTATVSTWLEGQEEPATRVRAYLDQTRPAEDQPTPPLLLKVWIDRDGVVERLEFTPFAHEAANADLRTALLGRRLPESPPVGMLLPLRIAVQMPAAGENEARTTG